MKPLQFMWDGGNTRRYHTMPTLQQDTVGHHSYNVACVVMALRPGARKELITAALKHDMAEHKSGDMPAPAKRDMGIRETFAEFEDGMLIMADIPVEILLPDEKWVLKFADSLEGMRFCVQERAMGNRLIDECYGNFKSYVEDLLEDSFATLADRHAFNYLKEKYRDASQ